MKDLAIRNTFFPSIFSEFDTFFDDFFGNTEKYLTSGKDKFPKVDIYQTKDQYVVEAALAGYDKKNFNITIDEENRILSMEYNVTEGSKNEKDDSRENRRYLVREIKRSQFECRKTKIPHTADINKVSTEFDKGILKIVFPLAEQVSKIKKIEF